MTVAKLDTTHEDDGLDAVGEILGKLTGDAQLLFLEGGDFIGGNARDGGSGGSAGHVRKES